MAYVTSTAFKQYRGITTTADDALIVQLIARAQQQIESYTGRRFSAPTTASTHYFDADRDVSDDKRTLYLDEDLVVVGTITNGDGNTVATTHYVTEPRHQTPYYAIRLTALSDDNWTYTAAPQDAIQVLGRWAYSTSPPADIVHATIRLAAYMYAQKDVSTFDVTAIPGEGVITTPQGIPRDVKIILDNGYKEVR